MPPATRFPPKHRFLLVLILGTGFLLRLYRLGADSLWYDETVSALLAARPLAEMWAHTAGDVHPPLYYALLHLWTGLAGRSEWSLAFLSLWFGLAGVALVAHVGLRAYGPAAGLLAAGLAAVHPFAIWYAQEVRMYTLGVFWLLLALLAAWRFLALPAGASASRPALLFAIAAALSLWTLYYSAFALIALNLFVLVWLWRPARGRLWPWLLAQAAALLLYLPWLPLAWRQALHPPVPPWREPLPFLDLILQALREGSTALALGQSVDPLRWWPAGLAGIGLALAAFGLAGRLHRGGQPRLAAGLLWTTVAGPLALILLGSVLLSPLYHVRYLYLYSGAYPVLMAAGLLALAGGGGQGAGGRGQVAGSRWRGVAAGLVVVVFLAGAAASLCNYFGDRYGYEAADDLRGAVQSIYRHLGPRDAVLINAGYLYPAFLYYWPGEIGWLDRLSRYPPIAAQPGPIVALTGHVDGRPSLGGGDAASDFFAMSRQETEQQLQRLFAGHDAVWLLRGYDTVNDPDGVIRAWLQEHGLLYLDLVFPGRTFVRAQAWDSPAARAQTLEPGQPLRAGFTPGMLLLGYDLSPAQPLPGQPLRLALYWQADVAIDRSYKVFNQVLDASGQVVAQEDAYPRLGALPTDRWPVGAVVSSSFVLHLPADLPGGEYRLITGFYDETTGQRAHLADGEDHAALGWFHIP